MSDNIILQNTRRYSTLEFRPIDNSSPGTPIYLQVAEILRGQILSGKLGHGEKLPPEAALAAMLGINHQTLRKGLAILASQKLITQCKGRGTFVYTPRSKSMRIGVLVTDFSQFSEDLYVLRMMAALNGALNGECHGELVLLSVATPGELMPRINAAHCDALIVLYANWAVRRRLCQPDFDHFPMVFVNAQVSDLAACNRFEVRMAANFAEMAVNALYRKGHRKIGFVSCNDRSNLRLNRHNRNFVDSCVQLGISTEYIRLGKCSSVAGFPKGWYSQAQRLACELCMDQNRPTAIVCPGFSFSCGAWQGILDAGLHIPDDMAFIGFDANSNVNPNMSALQHPVAKIAAKVIDILFSFNEPGKHLKTLCYEFSAEFNRPEKNSF